MYQLHDHTANGCQKNMLTYVKLKPALLKSFIDGSIYLHKSVCNKGVYLKHT